MDSGEGAAGGIDVRDGGAEDGEFLGIADDFDFGSYGADEVEGAGEQGLAGDFQKGFVGAHAGAFAAGEDERGEGRHAAMILGAAGGTVPCQGAGSR